MCLKSLCEAIGSRKEENPSAEPPPDSRLQTRRHSRHGNIQTHPQPVTRRSVEANTSMRRSSSSTTSPGKGMCPAISDTRPPSVVASLHVCAGIVGSSRSLGNSYSAPSAGPAEISTGASSRLTTGPERSRRASRRAARLLACTSRCGSSVPRFAPAPAPSRPPRPR